MTTKIKYIILTLCLVAIMAQAHPIIPTPQSVTLGKGYFAATKQPATEAMAVVTEKNHGEEYYRLVITPQKITCYAASEAGVFYAKQSLLQLPDSLGRIPCMTIVDEPRFAWRGLMLDVSRHFFGKEVVMQQLDMLARLKMNRYHLHLTDETGWRIEIKQYPALTGVGAEGNWSDRKAPRTFYTQNDIREIVEYARERHIQVIPEIDMPGHATAVYRAYPEFSTGGTGRWAGFTFYPAAETTYTFLRNVLTEVAALFPAPYIHIGGDEVHFGNQVWKTDPQIQQFIRDNNLGDEAGLEHYFVRRACEIIADLGKTVIGWDEIIEAGVPANNMLVMWWRHDKPQILDKALKEGFRVILSPRIPCYLDFVQDDSHKIGRRWGGAFNTLEVAYRFPESIQAQLTGHESQVLGIQANIWTERIADKKRLDFMTFPRLAVIAEDAWSPAERKNEADFKERLPYFLKYLDTQHIEYFNPFNPASTPEPWGPEKADATANG
ncbi:beta-hexosaminidase [Bacteroidia bacterium]|nr:beta-hexosaminidase [Bacteroidia bacterium]